MMFHVKQSTVRRTAPMKLIILGRDGVINEISAEAIRRPDDWQPLPGSLEAIARLNRADYRVVVASNQPDIGRGLIDMDDLNRIHEKMQQQLQRCGGVLDAIFICPADDETHPDRKPNPGMLQAIAKRLGTGLDGVPVIGDSLEDIQAARAARAQPLLVLTGRGEATAEQLPEQSVPVFPDLAAAADYCLRQVRA